MAQPAFYTATSSNGPTSGTSGSGVIYYGPNGGTATVINSQSGANSISISGPDGGEAVIFQSSDGTIDTATTDTSDSNNSNNNGSSSYDNLQPLFWHVFTYYLLWSQWSSNSHW